jgi:hypothetical protein
MARDECRVMANSVEKLGYAAPSKFPWNFFEMSLRNQKPLSRL